MKKVRKLLAFLVLAALMILSVSCGKQEQAPQNDTGGAASETEAAIESEAETTAETEAEAEAAAEKNGEVIVLFTSDVHCGIEKGFGYAGLWQVRQSLENRGYTTVLVDNGDSIQGETIGTLTHGEAMIDLMNAMHYDVAIPGNHEFDFSVDNFLGLTEKAEFPYISCNFNKEGELLFPPYIIKEAAGIKIAFVGVTTPTTVASSTPAYFQDENGNFVYGFLQDADGEQVYQAVQKAVDDARAEGADYVYVMGHLGMEMDDQPWTYADVISHTNGIDVFLDGHSHDTEQVVMKNKDGEDVVRSACGTKLNGIGYSRITPDGIAETDIWSWPNSTAAPELLALDNEMSLVVSDVMADISEQLEEVVARTDVALTIYDPQTKDDSGNPVRMVRRAETNLGDLFADAIRDQTGAEIALVNGGAVRTDIAKGDITYGDIISVAPFSNDLCIIEATGQQLLDALEWGVQAIPDQFGGFLQVAGMSYEVDISVPSSCTADENNMMIGIEGERRVKNVLVGGEPIDPDRTYTVAGMNYTLLRNGDGQTAFDGSSVISEDIKLDSQALIDYITETLGGAVGERYADPYGDGRIVITGE